MCFIKWCPFYDTRAGGRAPVTVDCLKHRPRGEERIWWLMVGRGMKPGKGKKKGKRVGNVCERSYLCVF